MNTGSVYLNFSACFGLPSLDLPCLGLTRLAFCLFWHAFPCPVISRLFREKFENATMSTIEHKTRAKKFRFKNVSVPTKSAKKAFPWSKERAKNKVFAFYPPSRPILRACKTPKTPFFARLRKRLLRRLVPALNGKPAFLIYSGLKPLTPFL